MKRIFIFSLFSFALIFALSNCASVSKAPEGKSEEAKAFNAPEGKGSVFLYRTGRFVGAAGQLNVKVNGIDAGGTGPGSFFKWDLKPGVYTFFSSTAESSATEQIDVKAGEVYFLRQDARLGLANGRVTIVKVDHKKGMEEVSQCKLLISAYVPEQ